MFPLAGNRQNFALVLGDTRRGRMYRAECRQHHQTAVRDARSANISRTLCTCGCAKDCCCSCTGGSIDGQWKVEGIQCPSTTDRPFRKAQPASRNASCILLFYVFLWCRLVSSSVVPCRGRGCSHRGPATNFIYVWVALMLHLFTTTTGKLLVFFIVYTQTSCCMHVSLFIFVYSTG